MRVAAACAVLVAAFAGALLVGRGSGDEPKADAPAEVNPIDAPTGSVKSPPLADTGNVPDLQETPEPVSTPSTGSSATSQPSTTAPSTGSTGGSTGGGGGGGGSPPTVRGPG